MLETAFDQLRFVTSVAFGRRFSLPSLHRLIAAMRDTRQEFGAIGSQGAEMLVGPVLDEETRREMQLRRFRKQAVLAAKETPYYRNLFVQLGIDPARLSYIQIGSLPLTSKEAVRDEPEAFVRRGAKPYLRATTTGTTGKPTSIYFSQYELQVYFALNALSSFFNHQIEPEDIVQISTASRGAVGNVCLAGTCAHIGAMVHLAGVLEPAQTLAMLSEKHHLPGKKERTSVLHTYPSYLGVLVEYGLSHGYRPADFGLERIIVGGELVSNGLKTRCRQLFGEAVCQEGYGMTEIWPLGGQLCSQGHLHFEVSQGLVEVYNHESGKPAQPGEVGTIVATPFPPYRETTLLLRYDTGDVVRTLDGPLTCNLANLPATSNLLGKRALSVRHEAGWTFPRQIVEALEAIEEIPLPARFGFWAASQGVGVEVVASKEDTPTLRRKLAANITFRLEEQGVPLRELRLVEDPRQLQHPFPLRGDLREYFFQNKSGEMQMPNTNPAQELNFCR